MRHRLGMFVLSVMKFEIVARLAREGRCVSDWRVDPNNTLAEFRFDSVVFKRDSWHRYDYKIFIEYFISSPALITGQ